MSSEREPLAVDDCLDFDMNEPGACSGPVELRMPLSPSGRPFPRCESHWSQRLVWQAEHDERYPDSDVPPAWFDPMAAGERWSDDD
jgi:hypothetical protein